jgi:hypothetical protein
MPLKLRWISDGPETNDKDPTAWLGWEDSNSQMSLPKLAFEVWPEFPFHFGTFSDQRLFLVELPKSDLHPSPVSVLQ